MQNDSEYMSTEQFYTINSKYHLLWTQVILRQFLLSIHKKKSHNCDEFSLPINVS